MQLRVCNLDNHLVDLQVHLSLVWRHIGTDVTPARVPAARTASTPHAQSTTDTVYSTLAYGAHTPTGKRVVLVTRAMDQSASP